MKKFVLSYRIFCLAMVVVIAIPLWGQEKGKNFELKDGEVLYQIELSQIETHPDSILLEFGTSIAALKEIWSKQIDTTIQGWKLVAFDSEIIQFVKNLGSFTSGDDHVHDLIYLDEKPDKSNLRTFYPDARYGVNDFKMQAVKELENGNTQFTLPDNQDADVVYLSGSFNSWSTLVHKMKRDGNNWTIDLELPPGKHLYKFIVDGKWIADPSNNQSEKDEYGGKNSVYFRTNTQFTLGGHSDARRVYLAASFNNWNKKELRLEKSPIGWSLPMYLKEGTHAYKYIVDGEWILDPSNSVVRPDGIGNVNNYISIGDTLYFRLRGFMEASKVILAGDFNVWNTEELQMIRDSDEWVLPYVLGPGNYAYKYIVDGNWILDPDNPLQSGTGDYTNSLKVVKPNITLILKGHSNANNVFVAGTFNGWNPKTLPMQKVGQDWVVELFLKPGKHLYKFVIDGEWEHDLSNSLWEKNEFGEKNSIIWINPEGSSDEFR